MNYDRVLESVSDHRVVDKSITTRIQTADPASQFQHMRVVAGEELGIPKGTARTTEHDAS